MSAGPGAGISVRGGRGGIAVALDDLRALVAPLLEDVETVRAASFAVRGLDLWSVAAVRHGFDVAGSLTQIEWDRRMLEEQLAGEARGLGRFTSGTLTAIRRYTLAEELATANLLSAGSVVSSLTRIMQVGAGVFGLLDDGRPADIEEIPVDAESRIELFDLASIVTAQSILSGHPVVRVIEQPRPDGTSAWIVQVPGTQVWDPRAGEVAHDLTSDVRLMSRQQGVLTESAVAALRAAQESSGRWGKGDPVLLSGHSLGGIAAMAIASEPTLVEELNITHVVTMGSPVSIFDPPDDVQIVSFEHTKDPVPALDLTDNPDRASWTTVTRNPSPTEWNPLVSSPLERGRMDVDSHGAIPYRETARLAARAIDEGTEPSLVHWAATAAPFFRITGGASSSRQATMQPEQEVRDYRVGRVTQSRP